VNSQSDSSIPTQPTTTGNTSMNPHSDTGHPNGGASVLESVASLSDIDGAFDPDRTIPANVLRPKVRQVALPGDTVAEGAVCSACGTESTQLRCRHCGQWRPVPDRCEDDLGAVVVATDRGIVHAHNDDSVAAAVVDDTSGLPLVTVVSVCDGVSSSRDPHVASGTAARTGVDTCLAELAGNRPADGAARAGLAAAARAVCDLAVDDSDAPSCTSVSAIVLADTDGRVAITVANVGDSRAYWLSADLESDEATPSQRLTVDDSYAQALVEAGAMDEYAAMKDPRAHTVMRWLGADAGLEPWASNSVQTIHASGPGVLLLCTDGLWNYLPEAGSLAHVTTGKPPMVAARDLVDYALARGGSDNITVALVPVLPLAT